MNPLPGHPRRLALALFLPVAVALAPAAAEAGVGFSVAPGSPVAANYRPSGIAAGDLNGDGRDDLVVANGNNPGKMTVLLAGPGGQLAATAASPLATGASTTVKAVALGDVNTDGKLDAVLGTDDVPGEVEVMLGDGAGGFTKAAGSPESVGAINRYPLNLRVVDATGDGRLDVVTANYGLNQSGAISILAGDGAGGFAPAAGSPFATGTDNIYDVESVDLNGDGRRDLVGLHYDPDGIRVRRANANGTYQAAASLVDAGAAAARLRPMDVDRDGKLDLVFAKLTTAGTVSVLKGNGSGAFGAFAGSPFDTATAAAGYGLEVLDVDADGLDDVVTSHDVGVDATKTRLSVLLGTAGGALAPASGSPFALGSERATALAVGDFNGDAQPDAATSDGRDSGHVAVRLNTNAGSTKASPGAVDFGPVAAGGQALRSVGFTNTGTGFSRMGAAGVTGQDFTLAQDGCAGRVLAVGSACTVSVALRPGAAGPRAGSVSVQDTPGGTRSVALSGSGTAAAPRGRPAPSGTRCGR